MNYAAYKHSVLKHAFEGHYSNGTTDWKPFLIEDLLEEGRKCAYGVLQPGNHIESGVTLIRVGDIDQGNINTGELKKIDPNIAKQYKRTFLKGREILITLVGAIGRTAVVPEALEGANTARAVGVIPIRKDINPHFIELQLRAPQNNNLLVGLSNEVARKTLNLEYIKSFRVHIPKRDVQDTVVAIIQDKLNAASELLSTVRRQQSNIIIQRQSILQKAFTGQLI